jgi:hypothetical protein
LKPAWANSSRDPISKNPSQKRAGGVAQGVGPEFKHPIPKKKKKKKKEEARCGGGPVVPATLETEARGSLESKRLRPLRVTW